MPRPGPGGSLQKDFDGQRLKTEVDRRVETEVRRLEGLIVNRLIGEITIWSGSTAAADIPSGWALCNGQELERSRYSKLFDTIGDTYGTPSSNAVFVLPDLADRVPAGPGSAMGARGNTVTNFHDAADTDVEGLAVPFIIYHGVT